MNKITVNEINQKLKYFDDPLFTFDEPSHTYRYNGKIIYGTTSFLERFVKQFDSDYWSKKKADEEGITQEEMLARWDAKRDRSCELGHNVHSYIENFYEKNITDLTEDKDANERIIKFHTIFESRLKVLESIGSEIKVFSKIWNIAGTIDQLYLYEGSVIVGDWKGLPIDTQILTSTGWKKMIDLQIGDFVFDIDGKKVKILHKSKIHNKKCIKLFFDNNEEIISDFEHRWHVRIGNNKTPIVMTTQEIQDYLQKYNNRPMSYKTLRIDNPKPLINNDKQLPLDPYLLGVWLGDGHSADSKITQMNEKVWKEIERRGYRLGDDISNGTAGKAQTRTVFEIRHILNELNLLKNKHIPEIYLLSSYEQRLDLLRGFMDADGHYCKCRKRYTTSSTRYNQIKFITTLLATLGVKSTILSYKKKFNNKKIQCWDVNFTTNEFNPFLSRNQDIVVNTNKQHKYRRICKAETVPTVPTVCIEVDSKTNTFLAGNTLIPTHNTNQKIKTDKDFCFGKLLSPFQNYKDNEINKYSLQISLYRLILEEAGIDTDYGFICHLPQEGDAKIYKLKDFRAELRTYLNHMFLGEPINEAEVLKNTELSKLW